MLLLSQSARLDFEPLPGFMARWPDVYLWFVVCHEASCLSCNVSKSLSVSKYVQSFVFLSFNHIFYFMFLFHLYIYICIFTGFLLTHQTCHSGHCTADYA